MKIYASALTIFNGRMLVIHHKKQDAWIQPGGKVELGETVLNGLVRELREETGLSIAQIYPALDGSVLLASDYELAGLEKISCQIFKKLLWEKAPHVWPGCPAPAAAIVNEIHIDLFYIIEPCRDNAHLNPREHFALDWILPSDLNEKKFQDPLLQFLAPMAFALVEVQMTAAHVSTRHVLSGSF